MNEVCMHTLMSIARKTEKVTVRDTYQDESLVYISFKLPIKLEQKKKLAEFYYFNSIYFFILRLFQIRQN